MDKVNTSDVVKYDYDYENDLIIARHYDPITYTLKETYKYSKGSVGSISTWRNMISILQSDTNAIHKLHKLQVDNSSNDTSASSIVSNKELMIKAIENLTSLIDKSVDYANHSGYADALLKAAKMFAQDSEQTFRVLDGNYMTAVAMLQNALIEMKQKLEKDDA